jgi:hypothetical protein
MPTKNMKLLMQCQKYEVKAKAYIILHKIVRFKDLQRLVAHSQQENITNRLFQRLKDKPFWIWDKQQHKMEDIRTDGGCCFNHIIGLPTKEGEEKGMFDYEKDSSSTLKSSECLSFALFISYMIFVKDIQIFCCSRHETVKVIGDNDYEVISTIFCSK